MRAAVHRTAVVPPVPRAANTGFPLEAVDPEAVLLQVFDSGQPARAGTDHADRIGAVIDRPTLAPDRRDRTGFQLAAHVHRSESLRSAPVLSSPSRRKRDRPAPGDGRWPAERPACPPL